MASKPFLGANLGKREDVGLHPDVGGLRYYSVYLPTDYDGHRPFPMIISFHAAKQEPATWPFVAITGGKGFIVVGMEYQADALPKSTGAGETDPWKSSVDTLRRIAARLRSDLKVDPRVIFIGGVGRGALQAQILASKSAELWAGVVILRAADAPEDAPVKSLAGKPILVAIPTVDPQAAAAVLPRKAAARRS